MTTEEWKAINASFIRVGIALMRARRELLDMPITVLMPGESELYIAALNSVKALEAALDGRHSEHKKTRPV